MQRPGPAKQQSADDRPLPMPHQGESDRVTEREWKEYRRRQAEHALAEPGYERGFRRPRWETVSEIWQLVEPFCAKQLPGLTADYGWLDTSECVQLRTVAKTALVIALDTFIRAGLAHQALTVNAFFDALARRYSDHHRASIAAAIWNMKRETVKSCRRDLHLNGVKVKELWEFIIGPWSTAEPPNPFFSSSLLPRVGQGVSLRKGSEELAQFREIISRDRRYRSKRRGGRRLLFAQGDSERTRTRPLRQEICAETPYNIAVNGRRGERLLDEQEEATLLFDTQAFMADYRRASAVEERLRKELKESYQIDAQRSDARPGRGYWSPRQEWIYCRVVHEGFRLGWRNDDARLDKVVRKRLKKVRPRGRKDGKQAAKQRVEARKKYGGHCERYLTWRKDAYKEGVPVVDRSGSRAPTPAGIIKAHAVAYEFRKVVRDLVARYDRAHRHITEYLDAFEQVERFTATRRSVLFEYSVSRRRGTQKVLTPGPYVDISTRVYRLANRRYQTRYLWPPEVTGKSDPITEAEGADGTGEPLRSRWFKARDPETGGACELVGFDVSSSQTQILAVAFGLRKLEDQIVTADQDEGKSFKEILAREAWRMSRDRKQKFKLRKGYKDAEDPRLVNLVKDLWMRVLYGSPPAWVVIEQQDEWLSYGPGWTVKNAKEFLKKQKSYRMLREYLDFARAIAQEAFQRDRYAGLRLRDPFDRAMFRWNPVERSVDVLKSMGQQLRLSLPGRTYTKIRKGPRRGGHRRRVRRLRWFEGNSPNKRGEYPTSEKQLYKTVAPSLVHMLDAFFSSLVMEKLAKKGVRDFVGIHDCWLVPAKVRVGADIRDGREVLKKVLEEATRDWYKGLGSFYDSLQSYVDKDGPSGRFLVKARKCWRSRLRKGRQPKFVVREAN